METRKGADIVVECLKSEGVEHVFGLIGSAVIDVTDAIYRTPGMRFIPFQHEQGAAYAADGYARVTGKPGICLVTVGPGATNALTGIAQAYVESSPVILISGEVATTVRGKGSSNWHEIDQLSVFRPITKLATRIDRVERIPEIIRQAFRVATAGRKGPVYVGLPRDVQVATSAVPVPPPTAYRAQARPRGDVASVRQAAELLLAARNPFVLAGGGVIWARAIPELLELMELLVMPGASTAHHRGIVPDDHPLGVGQVGTAGTPPALSLVQEADLLLAIGCTFSEVTTDRYGYNLLPKGAKIIHIDIDPEEIGKSYPVEVGIVGDAKAVLQEILAELKGRGLTPPDLAGHPRAQKIKEVKESWRTELARMAARPSPYVTRAQLVTTVRRILNHDAIVISEAGGTCSYSRFALECYRPIIIPGDFSAMGSGFCMALGAKTAFPEQEVVSISGDGAMMMVLPELFTAVENNIPVVVIVTHNNIYSNIKYKQEKVFEGRFIGVDHPYPNFADLAQAMGAYGERVEKPEDLEPALKRALASGRPAVVDVQLDPGDRVPPSKSYERWVVERQMPLSL